MVWATVPNVVTTYLAWAVLGLGMAATLYEPAFAVVARARPRADDRLRALATVTVLTVGLASAIGYGPLLAWLAAAFAVLAVTASVVLSDLS